MLNPQDRIAIEGLFDRLADVAGRSGPRDIEAEALVRERLQETPAAPYYMAQTILVQEHALRMAEQRIADLEAAAARRPATSGLLGGLWGGNETARMQPHGQASSQAAPRGPWNRGSEYRDDADRQSSSGGFLAGAAQTALGVTGGVLLGSAIASMLSGDAHAVEKPVEAPIDAGEGDAGGDDFGGFDIGGEF
ncbi:DUF2076 domain-containing protein [Devosia limi]|uniref:ABC transporter substrate-binding protein n=1 Tax=Devosia limi DSM 17137 TaxID=1121477 RepID=A0A1M4VTA2_9HYPH|nr:DUF2076 domain-containing protein [Devosia limi]SHE72351.1 hypothetical protein SAMN02745223_01007 [Devosia limi DSM 17137]